MQYLSILPSCSCSIFSIFFWLRWMLLSFDDAFEICPLWLITYVSNIYFFGIKILHTVTMLKLTLYISSQKDVLCYMNRRKIANIRLMWSVGDIEKENEYVRKSKFLPDCLYIGRQESLKCELTLFKIQWLWFV